MNMNWTLFPKSENHAHPLRISGKHLIFARPFVDKFNILDKKNINIYFDDQKKLIGLQFCEKESSSTRKISLPQEKVHNTAFVSISSLMKRLSIPPETKKGIDYFVKEDLVVFSYKDLVKDNNENEAA